MVEDLLREHGTKLDAIAVTVGPGSFTGLRGALALAHGLAIGAGIPVAGVTVAEALLEAAPTDQRAIWIALDSRRAGRIFLDCDGVMEAIAFDSLPWPDGPVTVLGDAAGSVVVALRAAGADAISAEIGSVSPEAVGRVAQRRVEGLLAPCPVQPLYIEPPEARPPAALRPAPV